MEVQIAKIKVNLRIMSLQEKMRKKYTEIKPAMPKPENNSKISQ